MGRGSNSSRLGRYNKSILLTELRRCDQASKAMLTQRSGLSPQAVSRIVDELDETGLVRRCGQKRGGKGQPSTLYTIDPSGAYAIGVKVGRRYMDLLLMDFGGRTLGRISHKYTWPDPEAMLPKIGRGLADLTGRLTTDQQRRLMGVGVAMPWFIGEWARELGMSQEAAEKWRSIDFGKTLAELTTLPVFFENDDSAAAIAELLFGCGIEISNFLYVYIGTFVGGGVVINGNLEPGAHGNSGAIASMPVPPSKLDSASSQTDEPADGVELLNRASLFVLQRHLAAHGIDVADDIADLDKVMDRARPFVDEWLADCADALVHALCAAVCVLDPEALVIDSQLPRPLIEELTARVAERLERNPPPGVMKPRVLTGRLGAEANAMGGAILPFYSNFVLDRTVLLTGGVPQRIRV
ncbi:MAG: ROK family transcriptional regulator [Wenzhouxiangellaceae bacterium]|nr:ROK family transcriptional regulator [Wenzhouxiangellaceae bacterium]